MAYAGHQFGHFVPQLGDGRANLLGEVVGRDGVRYDIQLKGSGPTPFSRGGDGRAALGPVLREYIVSEAMAALGVPTTRALAAVTTGERVLRETVLPGAVLTRVAASHLRVGTFQYFAARGDTEGMRMLADYAIARHYPEAAQAKQPYRALLDGVIARQAQPDRTMDAARLHPWRDEHRQHFHLRRDHRLRSMRLHGGIRSGQGVQLHRPSGTLCLWQSAPRRTLEPDASRRGIAARSGAGSGKRRGRAGLGQGSARCLRAAVRGGPHSPACAASLASSRSAKAMRLWPRTCWSAWPPTAPTSP